MSAITVNDTPQQVYLKLDSGSLSTDLYVGDNSTDVEELQNFLKRGGYLSSDNTEVGYGPDTKEAVIQLQKALGVGETGEWSGRNVDLLLNTEIGKQIIEDPFVIINDNSDVEVTITDTTPSVSIEGAKSLNHSHSAASFTFDNIPCFVQNMNTGTNVSFSICSPEDINESHGISFEDTMVKFRSSPFKAYNNSGPHSLSFTVNLVDDYCDGGILSVVNNLRAMAYPYYNNIILEPKIHLVIGDFINVIAVPTAIDITWKKPYRDNIYIFADVSFSLEQVENTGHFTSQVEDGELLWNPQS